MRRARNPKQAALQAAWGAPLALLLLVAGAAHAQSPVDELRAILLDRPAHDTNASAERERRLMHVVETRLTTFGAMREALLLKEWHDVPTSEHDDSDVIAADARVRHRVACKFCDGVRAVVDRGDAANRAAVCDLIAELAVTVRAAPDPAAAGVTSEEQAALRRAGFGRALSDELIRLTNAPDLPVRVHALCALGAINADPGRAAAVLGGRLSAANDVPTRRAAAEGLRRLVATASVLREQTLRSPPAWATDLDVLTAAAEVVRRAPAGLTDRDAAVRGRCAEALRGGGRVLAVLLQGPPADDPALARLARVYGPGEVAVLRGLLQAFHDAGPPVAAALDDPVVDIRLTLMQTLEHLAEARGRLAEGSLMVAGAGATAERVALVPPRAPDPLGPFARGDWRAVARRLDDAEVRVRRRAAGFLELFADCRPAAGPELTKALADADCFVRAAAARALGRFAKTYQPHDAAPAVPELARRLFDPDVAVRLAAAGALEAMGRYAAPAVPDVARAVEYGDADNRVAALAVLRRIGPDHAAAALREVTAALAHPAPCVRRAAAETLARFGPAARTPATIDALRRALADPDHAVRVRVGEAMREVLGPPPTAAAP